MHQVDAFTDTIFGGNPAGVVTNANRLSDQEMKHIAREMNLSETAFVLKSTSDAADVKFRFFTPATVEIDLCGHATIGALYELSRMEMYGLGKKGGNKIRVETNAGILEMSVAQGKDNKPRITFAAPAVAMEDYRLQGKAFANEFGIPTNVLLPQGKVLIDRKLNYIYIPIATLKYLSKLQFDFDTIRMNFADENIIVFCLYTNETFGENSDLHARVTGPLIGIDEDPFTGSTQSGLLHAAKQLGIVDNKQSTFIVEQGNFIGRPGFVEVTHDRKTDEVSVTASAVQVFSTILVL